MKTLIRSLLLIAMAAVLIPGLASAGEAQKIRSAHREAALKYLSSMSGGVMLEGTSLRNDSPGTFTAYHFDRDWLVTQQFGDMAWSGYSGEHGSWSGSNYGLPYQVEVEDNPANTVMEIITDGRYLEEPYWEHFHYVDEDAGGYNIKFTPEGLPPVDIVLYSDEDMPEYLQIMSIELPLAPHDDKCVRYRSFYYFKVDEEGRLLTMRETGREIDHAGESINFVEFKVTERTWLEERPEELTFDFERTPFSKSAASLDAPVDVDININGGYFLVPVTFEGSDEEFWFLLDTGASSSLFSPEAAEAAGLEPVLTLPTHGHGSRAEFTLGMCKTASLGRADADKAPLDGFTATRVPDGNSLIDAFKFYGTAGILGIAPLHQYVTTFDHPNKTMTFTPPHLFDAEQLLNSHTYVMELDVEDLVYCPAKLGDLEGEVIIDSGLQQDVALLRETVELNEIELEIVDQRNNTVVGGVSTFDYVVVPSFEIQTLPPPEGHRPLLMSNIVASMSEDDHGTLSARELIGFVGMTMFLDVKLTIDLFGQELYYEVPADMIVAPDDQADELKNIFGETGDETAPDEDDAELPVNID